TPSVTPYFTVTPGARRTESPYQSLDECGAAIVGHSRTRREQPQDPQGPSSPPVIESSPGRPCPFPVGGRRSAQRKRARQRIAPTTVTSLGTRRPRGSSRRPLRS